MQRYVFDFDGTCTTTLPGSDEAFISAHVEGLARMTNRTSEWMASAYAAANDTILERPEAWGWVMDGRIVAPATVDAFVKARVMAQIVLGRMGENLTSWDARLNQLYQDNYLKYRTEFRPELLEVFRFLWASEVPFRIVTNSDPNKVRERLAPLGDDAPWIAALVVGHAKEFAVTDGPAEIPESARFPGLDRPIYLRKQHYWNALREFVDADLTSDELVVVGDIAELDLALPVIGLGARGFLVLGNDTTPYERAWAEEHPMVSAITDLREIIA